MYLSNRNNLLGRKGNNWAFIISSFLFKNFRYCITPLKKELNIPLRQNRYSVIVPHKMALFQHSNNNRKNFCYSSSTLASPSPPVMLHFFLMIKGTEESTMVKVLTTTRKLMDPAVNIMSWKPKIPEVGLS